MIISDHLSLDGRHESSPSSLTVPAQTFYSYRMRRDLFPQALPAYFFRAFSLRSAALWIFGTLRLAGSIGTMRQSGMFQIGKNVFPIGAVPHTATPERRISLNSSYNSRLAAFPGSTNSRPPKAAQLRPYRQMPRRSPLPELRMGVPYKLLWN